MAERLGLEPRTKVLETHVLPIKLSLHILLIYYIIYFLKSQFFYLIYFIYKIKEVFLFILSNFIYIISYFFKNQLKKEASHQVKFESYFIYAKVSTSLYATNLYYVQ